jgi:Domain of unknown function (DUF4440)
MFCGNCGTVLDGGKFCPGCGKPVEARRDPKRRRRNLMVALVGAGAAVLVVGVVLAVALSGGSDTKKSSPVATTTTATQPTADVSEAEAAALAQRYASAWSAKSIQAMSDLLAPGYVRKDGNNPLQTRDESVAAYRGQMETLRGPRYELSGLAIHTGPGVATVNADYKVSSASGTTIGRIAFHMQRIGSELLLTRSDVIPGKHTPAPSPDDGGSPTTTSSTTPTAPTTTTTQYADTCTVKAWYSNYTSARYGYIHFKCVDDKRGTTVAEALGSDNFDFEEEQTAAKRTAKREELLNQVKSKLESTGWSEIDHAPGGEWYQLQFGR